MAARATRTASGRASASGSSDDGSRCLILALSHDELGVIVDGLADPLQPVVAVALSSTCLGLRTPLQAALEVLKERHARAVALCRKVQTSCTELRDAEQLEWNDKRLTTDSMATLAMILQTNGLPRLRQLFLSNNGFGDAGMQALCIASVWACRASPARSCRCGGGEWSANCVYATVANGTSAANGARDIP